MKLSIGALSVYNCASFSSWRRVSVLVTMLLSITAGEILSQVTRREYSYDALGNRVAALNLVRFASTKPFSIQPRRAVGGEQVNIFGRNFPAGDADAVAVSIGTIPATVLSISDRVIGIEVPVGAIGGLVEVSLNGGPPMTAGALLAVGVSISPRLIEVEYGESVLLTASVIGASSNEVQWAVNGVPNGNPEVGTISSGGLYTAPQAPTGQEFPFVISAHNPEAGSTGYAEVTLECNPIGPIGNRSFVSGSLVTPFERHCYEFTGGALQRAYIAYVGDTDALSIRLISSTGGVLASSGPGRPLRLADVIIPESGQYHVEVHADAMSTGSYQIWLDQHGPLADGVWMFPGDEFWEDPSNWSNGRLPDIVDDVVINDQPGDITVTVSQGLNSSASVLSEERLRLVGGVLSVRGDVQVNNEFTLDGGTLADATIQVGSGGQQLNITANTNRLDGVTVNGDLTLSDHSFVQIGRDLDVNGTVHMAGSNARLTFEGTQSVSSGTVISFEAATGIEPDVYMVSPGTVTLEPGVVIRGGPGAIGGAGQPMILVNKGKISADVPGQMLRVVPNNGFTNSAMVEALANTTLHIGGPSFTNTGTVDVMPGATSRIASTTWVNHGSIGAAGATLSLSGDWTTPGPIDATGGTLNLGGDFETSSLNTISMSGSEVKITGTLDNRSSTLRLDGSNGSWTLDGTLLGGTLNLVGGANLDTTGNASNRLVGVAVNGDLTLTSLVRIAGGLDVNGTVHMIDARMAFEGTQSVSSTTTISLEGTESDVYMQFAGTLTLEEDATVRGGGVIGGAGQEMTLVNEGTISVSETSRIASANVTNSGLVEVRQGAVLTISRSLLANSGMIALLGGTLTAPLGVDLQGGLLTGSGTVDASVTNNGADIQPGGTGAGLLTLNGDYTHNSGSVTVDLGGVTPQTGYDQFVVSGAANFGGVLNVNLINGFSPQLAQTFDVVTYSSHTGMFTLNPPLLGGGLQLQQNYMPTVLQLVVQ